MVGSIRNVKRYPAGKPGWRYLRNRYQRCRAGSGIFLHYHRLAACVYHWPEWSGHDRPRNAGWGTECRVGHKRFGAGTGYSELYHKSNTAYLVCVYHGLNGADMRDLGTLPASIDGGSSQLNSYAAGINDAGQVAGGTQKFFDLGYGFQLYDTAFLLPARMARVCARLALLFPAVPGRYQ